MAATQQQLLRAVISILGPINFQTLTLKGITALEIQSQLLFAEQLNFNESDSNINVRLGSGVFGADSTIVFQLE